MNNSVDPDIQLFDAAIEGNIGKVRKLIQQGAHVRTGSGDALRYSAEYGHYDVVKCLIDHGVDIHAGNDAAIRLSSEKGHLPIVEYLVEHGCDIDKAIEYGNEAIKAWAMKYKSSKNQVGSSRFTAPLQF